MNRSRISANRAKALKIGASTFKSDFRCNRNHKKRIRWTGNGSCVECDKENVKKRQADLKVYRNSHREVFAEKRRQVKYGFKPGQFVQMLVKQKYCCALCSKPLTKPRIDHCHLTKKNRGLLCHHCNVGLGHFFHSIDLLNKAVEYLKAYL